MRLRVGGDADLEVRYALETRDQIDCVGVAGGIWPVWTM